MCYKMQKVFIFDIDGVLLEIWKPMVEAFQIFTGKTYSEEELLEISKSYAKDPTPYIEFGKYFQASEAFANLEPIPGMVEFVKELKDSGFDLYVITAAAEYTWKTRVENLHKVFGEVFKEVYCVGRNCKTDVMKDIATQYDISYFCDDSPENVRKSAEFVTTGIWLEYGPTSFRKSDLSSTKIKIARSANDVRKIVFC